jgi:hypothetical protein
MRRRSRTLRKNAERFFQGASGTDAQYFPWQAAGRENDVLARLAFPAWPQISKEPQD